jgi:DegV family protein with EDD domain
MVKVVTDSSAYIPEEALEGLDIPVMPLWLLWDGERFRDGVDIDPPTFYGRLRHSTSHPTTSQPSVGEFVDFFRRVGAGGDGIVAVLVTGQLSGTVASAEAAQADLPELDIRVVDSLTTSMGQGYIALAAARAAADGASVDEVAAVARAMRDRVHVLFAVDTLEYLHRGGRISGAKRLLGTALNIKPLLVLQDGIIMPLAQVRTKRRVVVRMLDEMAARLRGRPPAAATVIDVDSAAEADALAAQVRERFGLHRVLRTTVSPVIGVHAGPGTVGVGFYARE